MDITKVHYPVCTNRLKLLNPFPHEQPSTAVKTMVHLTTQLSHPVWQTGQDVTKNEQLFPFCTNWSRCDQARTGMFWTRMTPVLAVHPSHRPQNKTFKACLRFAHSSFFAEGRRSFKNGSTPPIHAFCQVTVSRSASHERIQIQSTITVAASLCHNSHVTTVPQPYVMTQCWSPAT